MNKELEVLEELNNLNNENIVYVHREYWNEIQKKLKVLEIIKSKRIDVDLFIDTSSYGGLAEYNEYCCEWAELTQEEYDLLKEVLL